MKGHKSIDKSFYFLDLVLVDFQSENPNWIPFLQITMKTEND